MIRARGVARSFGDKRALEPVDFDLESRGFLVVTGPNGSGKTTLLRLWAGLLIPTSGELEVDAERGQVGYLAHEPLVYRELTAIENLDLYGRLYRVAERRKRIGALARKDLLLELRARDTLPAMLLFIVAVLVVFHFALPTNASAHASLGLLWVAILFTALLGLGRSFVAEREQGVLDGLVLAPSD